MKKSTSTFVRITNQHIFDKLEEVAKNQQLDRAVTSNLVTRFVPVEKLVYGCVAIILSSVVIGGLAYLI